MITKLQYDNVSSFNENLAAVDINNKWGFINTKGDMIIKPQFTFISSPFSNGVALVSTDNTNFQYINIKGDIIYNINQQ